MFGYSRVILKLFCSNLKLKFGNFVSTIDFRLENIVYHFNTLVRLFEDKLLNTVKFTFSQNQN